MNKPLSYIFYKDDFSDREFYDLVAFQLGLPEYADLFDREGEVCEDYQQHFSEGASVEVLHENLRITDQEALQTFLLDYAQTNNSMDEGIKYLIEGKNTFQLSGDGGGLGFILDIWENQEALNDGEEPIGTYQLWFDQWED
jgi:hypothetical protein